MFFGEQVPPRCVRASSGTGELSNPCSILRFIAIYGLIATDVIRQLSLSATPGRFRAVPKVRLRDLGAEGEQTGRV
jgi:hypothetical protein